jgi:hypothetical protein
MLTKIETVILQFLLISVIRAHIILLSLTRRDSSLSSCSAYTQTEEVSHASAC